MIGGGPKRGMSMEKGENIVLLAFMSVYVFTPKNTMFFTYDHKVPFNPTRTGLF